MKTNKHLGCAYDGQTKSLNLAALETVLTFKVFRGTSRLHFDGVYVLAGSLVLIQYLEVYYDEFTGTLHYFDPSMSVRFCADARQHWQQFTSAMQRRDDDLFHLKVDPRPF